MSMHFDKLFQTVVREKASDLHLIPGQPPLVGLHGRLIKLDTRAIEPNDTEAVVKSITPESNQHELDKVGGTDFEYDFSEKARFRVAASKQHGAISLVLHRIPNTL